MSWNNFIFFTSLSFVPTKEIDWFGCLEVKTTIFWVLSFLPYNRTRPNFPNFFNLLLLSVFANCVVLLTHQELFVFSCNWCTLMVIAPNAFSLFPVHRGSLLCHSLVYKATVLKNMFEVYGCRFTASRCSGKAAPL